MGLAIKFKFQTIYGVFSVKIWLMKIHAYFLLLLSFYNRLYTFEWWSEACYKSKCCMFNVSCLYVWNMWLDMKASD